MTRKAKPRIRCAIYTRKSHEEGLDQDYNSLDAQRDAGEAYVASQRAEGWLAVAARYEDGGFSGGNMERPGLRRLLHDIEEGRVDCVVVYKVDRLSRSLFDFARMMETFERHGVSFVSVTQQFNTTHSMGRLTLNILLSFAQFEREIIGERIRDKISAQRRRGKWTGGSPVLGYDVDRTGGSPRLVVNSREATRVRKIFERYLEVDSLLALVDDLRRRRWRNKSWRTRSGDRRGNQPFDKGRLYALLTNPIYIGRVRHAGETFEGEHEAIVPTELFEGVQKRLQANGRFGGSLVRNKHGALLRGLLVCGRCGRRMSHTFTGRTRRYRYYVCSRRNNGGAKACATRSLPAAEIERAVVEEIRAIGRDKSLRAEVLEQARQRLVVELEVLRVERRGVEFERDRQQAELQRLVETRAPSRDETIRITELGERLAEAGERLAEIEVEIASRQRDDVDEEEVVEAFRDFDAVWSALSPGEQANLVELLVDQVTFNATTSSIAIAFHDAGIRTLSRKGART